MEYHSTSRQLLALLLLVAPVASGCGYSDGGDGSASLLVVAEVEYWGAQNDMAEAQVTVSDAAGDPVTEATVILTDGDTKEAFTLTLSTEEGQDGTYIATIEGYRRRLALSVEADTDNVSGQVEGPGTHVVITPIHGSNLSRSSLDESLQVRWKTIDGLQAEEIIIQTADKNFVTTHMEDTGSQLIPTERLTTGSTGVQVLRRNRVQLDGGIGNSSFEIIYAAESAFQLAD